VRKDNISKEELLQAIQQCAMEMGHPPSMPALKARTGIHEREVRRHFITYRRALAACGLRREGTGYKVSEEALFQDWAELARKLGQIPKMTDYDLNSRLSHRPLITRFGSWRNSQLGLLAWAEKNGWEEEWKDVMDMLREHLRLTDASAKTSRRTGNEHSKIQRMARSSNTPSNRGKAEKVTSV
jgi:hypothetical protein